MSFNQGYGLIIGVNTYQYAPQLDVPVAGYDAAAVAEILSNPEICGYPPEQLTKLSGKKATRAGILDSLDSLASKVQPENTVFIFHSGHGDYGTDGSYSLICHDSQIRGDKIISGTGIGEKELLEKIKLLPAKRLLIIFNACNSGAVSPTLSAGPTLGGKSLPSLAAEALLATGSGRIVITACREEQYSWIGPGTRTIFTQALVEALQGKGITPRGGLISAFDLYMTVYESVSKTVRITLGEEQEPELTVLKGVGPFAVALFQGAQKPDPGELEKLGELPPIQGIHAIEPARSQQAYLQIIQRITEIDFGQDNLIDIKGDFIGGDHIEATGSQGFIHQASGPVEQNFDNRVNTAGGAYTRGNVSVNGGGDFIGRDKNVTILVEESAFDVRGLANPYLGLRSFTYADQELFAGREKLVEEEVARITDPSNRQALVFISGASGSGKSSFAQAGLLPALEQYYQQRGRLVHHAVTHPSRQPFAMLNDALAQFGLPELPLGEQSGSWPTEIIHFLTARLPPLQTNLLVIDQCEQLFTLTPEELRRPFCELLLQLASLPAAQITCLITLRSDYLHELYDHQSLWAQAVQKGIELRAMRPEEMKVAILRPLQVKALTNPVYAQKRFESALLENLSRDASSDPSYLPLLQVTLHELWSGGSLKLEKYADLADSIHQFAERVYKFTDFSSSQPIELRSEEEKVTLIEIFLDLVQISLEDDPRGNVRRGRRKSELVAGSEVRKNLIEALLEARLLSASREQGTQLSKAREPEPQEIWVYIIHDTLIAKWARLQEALEKQREALRRRVRFELSLGEWQAHGKQELYLLEGVHLEEANELERQGDIALKDEVAQEFLQRSNDCAAAEQSRWRELYRRAERRLRLVYGGTGLLVLLGFAALALLALIVRAQDELKTTRAFSLAAQITSENAQYQVQANQMMLGTLDAEAQAAGQAASLSATRQAVARNSLSRIYANTNLATLDGRPGALVYGGNGVWVALPDQNQLELINATTGSVDAPVDLGCKPQDLLFDGALVWTACPENGSVIAIDPSTGEVAHRVALPDKPSGLAYDGERLLVGLSAGEQVRAINPRSGEILETVYQTSKPLSLDIINNKLVVGGAFSVDTFDSASGRLSGRLRWSGSADLLSTDGEHAWITHGKGLSFSDLIIVGTLESNPSREGEVQLPSGHRKLTDLLYARGLMWATEIEGNSLLALDPSTGLPSQPISLGRTPISVAEGGGYLWAANQGDLTVQRIDIPDYLLFGPVEAITTGKEPVEIDYVKACTGSDGIPRVQVSDLYRRYDLQAAASMGNWTCAGGELWTIEENSLQSHPLSGDGSGQKIQLDNMFTLQGLAYANHQLWVAVMVSFDEGGYGGGLLSINPDTGEIDQEISLSQFPTGLVYDGRLLWVVNRVENTIQAINPLNTEIMRPFQLAFLPRTGLAFDGQRVWVASENANLLQYILVKQE